MNLKIWYTEPEIEVKPPEAAALKEVISYPDNKYNKAFQTIAFWKLILEHNASRWHVGAAVIEQK